MTDLDLLPPGLVVNTMKGDVAEHRAGAWLAWDGSLDLDCAIVGVPYDGASVVRSGSRHGPDAVRQGLMYFTTYSSRDRRAMTNFRAADIGDVPVVLTDMETTFRRISDTVRTLVARGIVPVMLGGDHSIAFPNLRGVIEALGPGKRLGVIHLDAHHDLRKAHLGAESSGVPFRKTLEMPGTLLGGRNLVQVGMAEFTNSPQLDDYAAEMGVTVIPGLAVRERGIADVVEEALRVAGEGTDAIYLSVDIDVLSHAVAPGTAAPNPFGLDLHDVQYAMRRIGASGKLVGADLVEISPPFDPRNITGSTGASLILSLLYGLSSRPSSPA
ncbi:agmatinase family protein [Labrys wisconsinensis]|uniref:Formimidoylglutamase n=1 Tax=Labrys wisconsinensis TaxID=425677 RepID=A0ABU0JMV7_9HYPH|nr:agmatinase family protein [Labrys wisconsinensis]MDQ0474629.1 formimidoylglutamase [Labrys wisconsinensis]